MSVPPPRKAKRGSKLPTVTIVPSAPRITKNELQSINDAVNKVSDRNRRQRRAVEATRANALVSRGVRNPKGSNPIKEYLRTLTDPFLNMARIPDAFDRPTACFRTNSAFTIPILTDSVNQGKFSFCLQPKIGDLSTPSHYQVAAVNPSAITLSGATSWSQVDWTQPTYYLATNGTGSDPRLDYNAALLTSPPPSFYGMTFSNVLGPGILMAGAPANQTAFTDNTTSFVIYSPDAPGPYPSIAGGIVELPPGDWNVAIFCKFAQTATTDAFEAINFQAVGAIGQVAYANIYQPQTVSNLVGVTFDAFASAQVVSSPGANSLSFCLSPQQSGLNNATAKSTISTVSSSTVVISPANFSSTATYQSGGPISAIRPVGMSVLVSYMGTELNNGGEIAVATVPGEYVASNYFSRNPNYQLQDVSTIRHQQNFYDGRLSQGCYNFWYPYDELDQQFMSPANNNARSYPAIVCSGYFSPDTTVANPQLTLRVQVCIAWEVTTESTIWETKAVIGSRAAVDAALSGLKGQPTGCANGQHLEKIKQFLKNAAAFYKQNSAWINPAATALMGLV